MRYIMAETPVEQLPAAFAVSSPERTTAEEQRLYWQQRFEQHFPMIELPIDRPRVTTPAIVWGQQRLEIPRALTGALQDLAQRAGVCLSTTLLAAFQALLARYSGQPDIVVGVPCGSGTLMIWTDVSGIPSFRTLLDRVQRSLAVARASQDAPADQMP